MIRFIVLISIFAVTLNCLSQNLNYQWTKTFGGVGNDYASFVEADSEGNIYMAGVYSDTLDIDPGADTLLVTCPIYQSGSLFQKYDNVGSLIWSKIIYGRPTHVRSICLDSDDNLYVLGDWFVPNPNIGSTTTVDFDPGPDSLFLEYGYSEDIFVLKFNKDGELIWAHPIMSNNETYASSIVADEHNNLIISGDLRGTMDFDFSADTFNLTGTGTYNQFILKIDSAANFIWAKPIQNTGYDESYALEVDKWNNIYYAVYSSVAPDLDPSEEEYILASNHGFISKYNENGDFQWAQNIGEGYGYPKGIMSDTVGNIFIAGHYSTGNFIDWDAGEGVFRRIGRSGSAFLLRLDTAGNFQSVFLSWSASHSLEAAHYSEANNSVIMGIHFESSITQFNPSYAGEHYSLGENDIALLEITDFTSEVGNFEYAKYIGGTSIEIVNGITSDQNGNIFTCGYFTDTTDFNPEQGAEELFSKGLKDLFFQKYGVCMTSYSRDTITICSSYTSPSGNYTWTESGSYIDTIQNYQGCDSIISIELNVNTNSYNNDTVTACYWNWYGYNLPDGNTVYSSGTYQYTLPNTIGCDSIISLELTLMENSYSYDTLSSCGSLLSQSGNQLWTTSGNYYDTIPNYLGCDSMIVLNLTITDNSYKTIYVEECDSYTSPSGNYIWTESGTYTDTIPSAVNCDSIITIDLRIGETTYVTDVITACDSYTWIDGVEYTSNNNNATWTIPNSNNCDSIITLNLTVNSSPTRTDEITACDSYTWIDGVEYTSNNNNATWTIPNSNNCDSIITLNLTVNSSPTRTDEITACDSYTWIDGVTYISSSNTATHTVPNSSSCDSIITLDLTINTVNTMVTENDSTITANAHGAQYQWLECPSMIEIEGENEQSFTTTENGEYAVEVTENGCTDISECIAITSLMIIENGFGDKLIVYPNPTEGNFSIDLGNTYQSTIIKITDLNGREIQQKKYKGSQVLNCNLKEPAGVYLIIIETESKKAVVSLVKE